MSQKIAVSAIACAPGALPGGPVRTRFFDGMFLTQADLETEQRFWRLKRRLTNRALGDGVVWGLKVGWNSDTRRLHVTQGYALDCCGNDLVVECPVDVTEAELWSRADPSLKTRFEFDPKTREKLDIRPRHACLVLQYTECAEDARLVHRDACVAGTVGACEPSRVRESARLLLVPPPKRRPTPPEKFLAELETWRDSLPTGIKNALFPPQGTPTTTPSSGVVPVHLIVSIPGSAAASTNIQPAASGATSPVALGPVTQNPAPSRRTGVVTFELKPELGWGFTAGTVSDQTRVVETVTPPVAPSMFWSLDVAVPAGGGSVSTEFEFRVDALNVKETFGGTRQGIVVLRINGVATVEPAGSSVNVRVDRLIVTTERADVAVANDQGCLLKLVPWGWTIDPTDGRRIAGTLLLAATYAFLSEVTRRGASLAWQRIAAIAYTVVWYTQFGAFPMADVPEEYRRKLAELILALYQRWCDGFAYAGPHCSDEHHGVYLGCAELDRSGRIVSFDMWEHRRYVVTGALLAHWAEQLGMAPLDVIMRRFASAMCCLGGLPAIALPQLGGKLQPGVGGDKAGDVVHVGTSGSVADFAKLRGAKLHWVSSAELARRAPSAFLGKDGPVDIYATQIENGGSIALAVPTERKQDYGSIRDEVKGQVRRGKLRVRERGRDAIADFSTAVFAYAQPTAVASDSAETIAIARELTEAGATLADVVEYGASGVVERIGPGTDIRAADELVDLAETALDSVVAVTVETLGPSLDRASFKDPEAQKKLAEGIVKKALPKLDRDVVVKAARSVVAG